MTKQKLVNADDPINTPRSKWGWKADWCRKMRVNPHDDYWWNEAEKAYNKDCAAAIGEKMP